MKQILIFEKLETQVRNLVHVRIFSVWNKQSISSWLMSCELIKEVCATIGQSVSFLQKLNGVISLETVG